MNKTVMLVASVIVVALAAFLIHRNSLSYKINHSGMNRNYPMKCASCGKKFSMTADEMESCIRSGKAQNQPNAYAQFPCPSCGKITAAIYNAKYENTDAEK